MAAAAVSGGANSSTPAAAVGGAGANGAWSAFAGIDQLHLMAVRSRLAQLITWRDTAARAGLLCVKVFWEFNLCCSGCKMRVAVVGMQLGRS